MTDQTFEYKALRFLNDRVELYNITDDALKIALYDFTLNEYNYQIDSLRNIGYIKNKDLYQLGLSITEQGQIRLQQLQKIVDLEKKQSKTFWEKITPLRDSIGTIGAVSAIILGWLTWSNAKENAALKTENKSLKDSIATYLNNNKAYQTPSSITKIDSTKAK